MRRVDSGRRAVAWLSLRNDDRNGEDKYSEKSDAGSGPGDAAAAREDGAAFD